MGMDSTENAAVETPGKGSQKTHTETSPTRVRKSSSPGQRKDPAERKTRVRKKVNGYKYDWFEVRTAFVEGLKDPQNPDERVFLNLRELSERMNVPVNRIRERSADERWFDLREQYQLKLAKTRQAKRILELSKESVDFDTKSLNAAKLGIAMVTKRMSEIARDVSEADRKREEALKLAAAGFDIDPEDLRSVIDARELDMLARAATQWQQLGQKAMGTDVQRMEIQQDINLDVDVEVTSISAELGRDDPERLAAFLQAAKRAGLLDTVVEPPASDDRLAIEQDVAGDSDDIVEAEIVET